EAVSVLRVVWPVEPIAIEQARPGVGKVAMPDEVGALEELDALHLAPPLGIEEAQLDTLGVLGEQREVDARPVPGGAEGIGPAAPERARRDDDAGRRFHVRSLIYANRCFLESRVEPGLQRVGSLLPHESSPGDSRCSHYFLLSGRVAISSSTLCRGAQTHEDRRPGPRWRGRLAPVSPDSRAREARAAVRERLPYRGLRAEQPGELENLDDLRARAVQARLADAPYRRRVGAVARRAGQRDQGAAAALEPAAFPRHRGRGAPVPRRAAGAFARRGGDLRRRPRLPHGRAPDDRFPLRARGRR